jgi:predicted HTH domain antitoxin
MAWPMVAASVVKGHERAIPPSIPTNGLERDGSMHGESAVKELILTYPDDLSQAIGLTAEELSAQLGLMAALKMFELGKLSSGKAAELAGLSRGEFFEACSRYRVSVFNYPDEEIETELQADFQAAGGSTTS